MEIADVYVLNKADRSGADAFYKNLSALVHQSANNDWEIPVIKTVATKYENLNLLDEAIIKHQQAKIKSNKKQLLLAEKAMILIKNQRIKDIDFETVYKELGELATKQNFNIYRYVKKYN